LFGGGGGGKTSAVPVAVTDLDRSPISQQLLAALRADPQLALRELPEPEAAALVRQGKLSLAVVLPAGFGAQAGRALFGAGPQPELTLHHDPSQGMALAMLRGLLSQHVMQVVSQAAFSPEGAVFQDLRRQTEADAQMPPAQRGELLALFDQVQRVQAGPAASASAPAGGMRLPFKTRELEARAPGQAGYNGYAHSFGGMGVQFILMMGVDMAVGLLLLRRMDLWKRLRAAPLSRATLLGSRTASCALIALGVFCVLFAVAIAFFGVRVHGSWLGFAGVLVAFSLFTASFGLLVAALGRTPEATRGLAIVVTLLLVMLGGAWVPSFVFPDWLQQLTLFIPTRWAVDGLDAMTWRGLGLEAALAPIGVLLAFALASSLLALWRFRWDD
jgi:ABC-2 type transport system permease protein